MRIRSLTILWALVVQCPIFAYAGGESIVSRDSVACSIEEMWQRTLHHHLLLNAKQKEVEVAKASLAQEKLWENPQISLSHNINNPVTHRYFEFNKEGQTDIQISQRIYIAGQRGERIRMASEEMSKAQYEQLDAERLMRKELSGQMVQLFTLQQKVDVVQKEVLSMDTILQAYEEQKAKGNVSSIEIMRISGLRLQLLQEKAELMADITRLQQSIRLMGGLDAQTVIVPKIDYAANAAMLEKIQLSTMKRELSGRSDIRADEHEVKSAEHHVKLQKANALPEINLTGEWDKNGSIGRNFFAFGVTFSLPVLNRNQGNIRAARASLNSKRLLQDWNLRQAHSEMETAWEKLQMDLAIVKEAEKHQGMEIDRMLEEVQAQYMKRNISLLELADYYQTYKNTHFLMMDSQKDVLIGMAEMGINIQ